MKLQAKLEQLAEQCAFKLTELRVDVLTVLMQSQQPLKAYDVLEIIQQKRPTAAPPTVYRVLDFFVEQGVIHKLDSSSRYSLCKLQHQTNAVKPMEILFICQQCSSITECTDGVLSAVLEKLEHEHAVTIQSQQIELQCICQDCK